MASGTIYGTGWETFSPTINASNGFALRSWGACDGLKSGNTVIVNVNGMYSSSEVTANKAMLTIPYTAKANIVISFAKDTAGIASIYVGQNVIYVNGVEANKNMYFQIVIPI